MPRRDGDVFFLGTAIEVSLRSLAYRGTHPPPNLPWQSAGVPQASLKMRAGRRSQVGRGDDMKVGLIVDEPSGG
jgi:hypothetical protein